MEITFSNVKSVEVGTETPKGAILGNFQTIFENCSRMFQSEFVETYFISLICVSKRFEKFAYPIKRPKFYKEFKLKPPYNTVYEKQFFVECPLDFNSVYYSNDEDCPKVIGRALMEFLENLKYPIALKKFEKEAFNQYVRNALTKNGYL